MVDTHLWNSIGISPSGSTIIACCKNKNNNNYYDIYSSINNTNAFKTYPNAYTTNPVKIISVIDNTYVLLCTNIDLYISKDNGISFSKVFGVSQTNFWSGVSISSITGKYMVACIGGGGIYLSADYGNNNTWGISLSVTKNFTSISISESGRYIVACYSSTTVSNGGIYTSSDYGSSWLDNQTIPTNLNWTSICIKEKYRFAVVSDASGYIYTSTSNGNIWVDASLNLPITTNFKKVCISDYGYSVALSNYNRLVTANYGENWTTKSTYNENLAKIQDIGVSTNGLLVMCDISNIYTSSIYSVYNDPKKYYSTDVSFITKGLLENQVYISAIFNTSFNVNFQNPYILPDIYNIVVQNSMDLTDPSQNIGIVVSRTNNNYSVSVSNLKENILYNINLQSIYINVISTIYTQQYTKGSPIDVNYDINYITDVSMNISFKNSPNTPNYYTINILNQSSSTDYQHIRVYTESILSYLTAYNVQTYPYTIYGLLPDSKYTLSITSNYIDVSYTSIPITNITTKSAPSNISYTLQNNNQIDITYNPPSYVNPTSITLLLQRALCTRNQRPARLISSRR